MQCRQIIYKCLSVVTDFIFAYGDGSYKQLYAIIPVAFHGACHGVLLF